MKTPRLSTATALVAALFFGLTPAWSAPPYVSNTVGTTANGQLDALTDIYTNTRGVAQGSTTSGQYGLLFQGATTTAAPTYATGQTNPLSLTTAGALRIDGSGVTQPISAASLPLPTGAATAAKQPALGTAGSPSADILTIGGANADGATATGAPVPVGGIFNSTLPTYTNGQRGQLQLDQKGSASVVIRGAGNGNAVVVGSPTAGVAVQTALWTNSQPVTYNGSTQDPLRSVTNGTDSTGVGIAAAGMVAQCDDTSPNAISENQFGNLRLTCGSRMLLVRPFEAAANTWSANVSLSDGTSTALHASCGAGLKNYLTWWNWSSVATTTAVTVTILDGATAKFDDDVAAGAGHSPAYEFNSPIAGTAATALNVQLSGVPTGPIKVRAGGYCAP